MMKVESVSLFLAVFSAQTEIHDLDVVLIVDNDVGRLDVPVDDALLEGIVQGQAALEDDADDAMQRQQLVEGAEGGQFPARDVLHHDVGLVVFQDGVENPDDIGVIELLRHRPLGGEQLLQPAHPLRLVRPAIEAHQLDRHRLGQVRRFGQVNGGRSAAPQFPEDPVFTDRFDLIRLAHSHHARPAGNGQQEHGSRTAFLNYNPPP